MTVKFRCFRRWCQVQIAIEKIGELSKCESRTAQIAAKHECREQLAVQALAIGIRFRCAPQPLNGRAGLGCFRESLQKGKVSTLKLSSWRSQPGVIDRGEKR